MGPRGLTVLSIAGIAGLLFGVHGWSQRDTGLVAPLVTSPAVPVANGTPVNGTPANGTAVTGPAAGPS